MSRPEHFRKFVQQFLDRMTDGIHRTISAGDVDAVHAVRVSSRRLGEPLEIMASELGRKRIRPLRRDLRRLRRSVRTVRSLDVLLASLSSAATSTTVDIGVMARIEGILTSRRQSRLVRAARRIRRLDAERLIRGIQSACDEFIARVENRDSAQLASNLERLLRRRSATLLARPPSTDEGADLHATRLRLKALRYCAELCCRIEGREKDDRISRLVGMQDRLGLWNDHIDAARRLGRMATRAKPLALQPNWSAAVIEMAADQIRQIESQREEVLAYWPGTREAVEALFDCEAAPIAARSEPLSSPEV